MSGWACRADEVELVAWLVGNHLLMSELAQKRDISDPRTVAQLVNVVGSVEHLRMLLVLTVADIRAVGPGLWNDWKGQLLRDLYRLTEAALHGGRSDEEGVRAHMAELAAQARQKLAADLGGDDALHDTWLTSFEDGYWLNHDAEALAWHAREMRQVELGATPYIATRVRPAQGITEVLIYADDHPGLFANLAAAISAAGADIAGARVHTTRGGAAFDVFSIQTTVHKPFGGDDRNLLTSLAARLRRAAVEDHSLPPPSPVSRRNSAFSIEPWVRIDNEVSQDATVIEASGRDRLGLLAELAHVCAAANVSIVSAHIDTHGARASDVFYVQETAGGKIVDPARIAELRASLEIVLAAGVIAEDPRNSWAVAPASTAR